MLKKSCGGTKRSYCSDTLQVHDDSNTSARHLTLFGLQVLSNILKQPFTEFRNQAFVGSVAHHRVTLPRAGLPIGQQCGIVTLQTLFEDRSDHLVP